MIKFNVLVIFVMIPFYGLAQCDKPVQIATACEPVEGVSLDEASNTICFNGAIDHNTFDLIKTLPIDRSRPLHLVANSDGGVVNPSIDITEYLDNYNIYVTHHCLSACAQFLFMQAENKYIIHDGIVAIHGGPIPVRDIIDFDSSDEDKINLIRENLRFAQFYHDRKINMDILTNPPAVVRERLAAGETVFWLPKKAEFELNNVHNIHYCDSKFGK